MRLHLPLGLLALGALLLGCQSSGLPDIKDDVWALQSLNGVPVIEGSAVTLTLHEKGNLSGTGGCNQYSGRYEAEGGRLAISPAVTSTLKACVNADMMRQERAYLNALPLMTHARVEDEKTLHLSGNRGEGMVFGKVE